MKKKNTKAWGEFIDIETQEVNDNKVTKRLLALFLVISTKKQKL